MSESVVQYNWNNTSLCSPCFYGSICQFTTSYYSISLEALFGTFVNAGRVIAGIIFILLVGTICNILSIATFCQVKSREMGNGIYRLWIAIIGQFGLMSLATRLLLMFARNGSGIVECFGLDYLISVLPSVHDSLTACVTIERTVVIYQNLSFNKGRSRHMAKRVIPILILYHFLTAVHEPFHRRLLSDPPFSDRLWCSLHLHTRFLSMYERTTNIVHLVLPFALNLFTPLYLLITLTRRKAKLNKNTTTWSNFKHVLYTYKHNVISPYLLVLLLTPRLVLTFHLTCITQPWQNTAYLVAYFISLVPLMTSLFIFVLPSPKYRKEFQEIFQRAIRYARIRQYE